MSKYCPIVERTVTYQFCQDCDDKVCEQKKYEPKSEPTAKIEECICDTCNHKCDEYDFALFGKTRRVVRCDIFRNTLFNALKLHTQCDYHNVDITDMEICLNCEHYLGGGDWGLTCADDYYKLPGPTSKACEHFKRKVKGN